LRQEQITPGVARDRASAVIRLFLEPDFAAASKPCSLLTS